MMVLGMKNGEILRGPAARVIGVRLLDHRQAADAGADANADALGVLLAHLQPGILERLHPCRQAEMDEAIHAARILGRKILGHIESLHLSRYLAGESRRIEA